MLKGGYGALLDLVKSGVEPTLLAILYYQQQQQQHGKRKPKNKFCTQAFRKSARSDSNRAEQSACVQS